MKIDLHVHTRKVPNKDNQKRDISPNEFCEIMEKAKVTIVAITNHNFFDLEQYKK